MAKYTLEEIMRGDIYGIESAVFVEVFKMVEEKIDAKTIREQLNMIYVKHALLTAKKMIEEGASISDIPELERSLCVRRENNANTRRILVWKYQSDGKTIPKSKEV